MLSILKKIIKLSKNKMEEEIPKNMDEEVSE